LSCNTYTYKFIYTDTSHTFGLQIYGLLTLNALNSLGSNAVCTSAAASTGLTAAAGLTVAVEELL
jgi:hypothetical protein